MNEYPRFLHYPLIDRSVLSTAEGLKEIYGSEANYYLTSDWSPECYCDLAFAGFIAITSRVAGELMLLPEMQTHYALLDFGNLHASRSMRRWMKSDTCRDQKYELQVRADLEAVIDGLNRSHYRNWMRGEYVELLKYLFDCGPTEDFELIPTGLFNRDGVLVAGEVGYRTGNVYTSLSGFFDRFNPAFKNSGKLQLIRLGEYLRDNGFAFWNLGHPWMQYKIDLGAVVLPRDRFLERWLPEAWPRGLEILGGVIPECPFSFEG